MESRVNYTVVGLFSIVFLAAFAIAVFWFGKFGIKDDYDRYRVLATESVSGLSVEAPVKYRGVVVGSVADIRINTENTELIEIILKVKKNTPIKVNSVASLKPQGITGLSFVDITPGDNKTPLLMNGKTEIPTIRYGQSLFGKFDATFTVMADSLQNILEKVDAAMSERNMAKLSKTLQNLEEASAKLSIRLDELGEISRESKDLPSSAKDAIKKVSSAADSVNAAAAKIDGAMKRGDFDFKKDITKVTNEATKLLENLRELSKESNTLVKDLQKNPSSLVFDSKDIPKGPGE